MTTEQSQSNNNNTQGEGELTNSSSSTSPQSESSNTNNSASAKTKTKGKKRTKRLITDIIVHVYASFNNTIITVTDVKGNALSWATAGGCGFRGSRKSTPFAGQVATGKALQKAKELYGVETAEVRVYGPGPGRDASVRAVRDFVHVSAIFDVSKTPFNGCRPPNERRV